MRIKHCLPLPLFFLLLGSSAFAAQATIDSQSQEVNKLPGLGDLQLHANAPYR
jgi:hypothetical protein